MSERFTYEVTDTGKYYYENNTRIFPEQFWSIIQRLDEEIRLLRRDVEYYMETYKVEEYGLEMEHVSIPSGMLSRKELLYETEKLIRVVRNLEQLNSKLKKENEDLKQTIDTICDDYEKSHGMSIRNADWFTAW